MNHRQDYAKCRFSFNREVYVDMDLWKEALAEGLQMGLINGKKQGAEEKAIEDAVIAVKEFNIDPKLAAEKMNAPLDKVMEKLSATDY